MDLLDAELELQADSILSGVSGVTTDNADPAMRGGPRAYGGTKLWHYFFSL